MGVDASYLYGYMAKSSDIEWDIDYLKQKFNLEEKLTGFLKEYTYADLIDWLENDDIDDWCDLEEIMNFKNGWAYDEHYVYFTHFELAEQFPDRQLKEMKDLAGEYASKVIGVKNPEAFKWNEFGFFD